MSPFAKIQSTSYPRRLWALTGFPGSGKSTFATQMRSPLLVVDSDHRFDEVAGLVAGETYQVSDVPADNVNVEQIARQLHANMPGAAVRTIVVDSLTAIITPLVVQAVMDNDAGRNKNRMSAFRDKALAMRLLQDSVTMWGTDALFVYHLQSGRNERADEVTTSSISRTELARLLRSINLQLRIVDEQGRRGVRVEWARRGRAEVMIWDETGRWVGMPEKIEEAVYGGLSKAAQDAIEGAIPSRFAGPEQAIVWGLEQGVFQALQHSRNAYDKVKAEHSPKSAQEMWDLWIADVASRKAAFAAEKDGQDGSAF